MKSLLSLSKYQVKEKMKVEVEAISLVYKVRQYFNYRTFLY